MRNRTDFDGIRLLQQIFVEIQVKVTVGGSKVGKEGRLLAVLRISRFSQGFQDLAKKSYVFFQGILSFC
jgi:hypothetical protein